MKGRLRFVLDGTTSKNSFLLARYPKFGINFLKDFQRMFGHFPPPMEMHFPQSRMISQKVKKRWFQL